MKSFFPIIIVLILIGGAYFIMQGMGSGRKVDTHFELATDGNPVVAWKRSQLFYRPILINDEALWKVVQDKLGRPLQTVDFEKHSVVGAFAFEVDRQEVKLDGSVVDKGYYIKLASAPRIDSKNTYTFRYSAKAAPFPERAQGPLHYHFSVVDRIIEPPKFYMNGKKLVTPKQDPTIVNQRDKRQGRATRQTPRPDIQREF